MMTVAQKIYESIKRNGFSSVKECAQTLDIPYELLRKVVGDDHIPKDKQLLIYAKKLNIDPIDLLFIAYHQKTPSEFKQCFHNKTINECPDAYNGIPKLSWKEAKEFVYTGSHRGEQNSHLRLRTNLTGEHLFALEIIDDALKPLFWIGDTIIVDASANPRNGDYAVIDMRDDEEPILRKFIRIGKIRTLVPLNPQYKDIEMTESMKFIGRVIRKQADYYE